MQFKMRGINVPKRKQRTLWLLCQSYGATPDFISPRVESAIAAALYELPEDYRVAVEEAVTTDERVQATALRHHLSPSTLGRMINRFYEHLFKKLMGK